MAESDETPAQRQARIRRQKREAKINANATERLDKITQLSGRQAESSKSKPLLASMVMLILQCGQRPHHHGLAHQRLLL